LGRVTNDRLTFDARTAAVAVAEANVVALNHPWATRRDVRWLGFSVTLGIPVPADAERVFEALAKGGTVRMPLQETFWAARFGMLVDQFGIPWMINCEKAA